MDLANFTLPVNEKSFTFSLVGETTGIKFDGTFKCTCCPTIGMRNEADRIKAFLNAGVGSELNEETRTLHYIMGVLQTRLLDSPEWFKKCDGGKKLMDDNVLVEIFNEIMKAEKEWKDKVWAKKEEKPVAVEATK